MDELNTLPSPAERGRLDIMTVSENNTHQSVETSGMASPTAASQPCSPSEKEGDEAASTALSSKEVVTESTPQGGGRTNYSDTS